MYVCKLFSWVIPEYATGVFNDIVHTNISFKLFCTVTAPPSTFFYFGFELNYYIKQL